MAEHSPRYTIYLLTVWFDPTVNASDPSGWRFRLENPRTKETRGFVGMEGLTEGLIEAVRIEIARTQSEAAKRSGTPQG